MKRSITTVSILLIITIAGWLLVKNRPALLPPAPDDAEDSGGQTMEYVSRQHGFEFEYPKTYRLEERNTGTEARYRQTITLISEADYQDLQNRQGGEGPVAITFDIFQNNIDQQTVEAFVSSTNDSNYKLPPDEPFSTTTVAGKQALRYRWDGLYSGESAVFAHNGNIVMASVTYLSPDDQIRKDFDAILKTLEFSEPKPLTETDALNYIKGMFPELAAFPSSSLPPKTLSSERGVGAWHFAFQTEGSGVQYILDASCYSVTDSKEVAKTGSYTHPGQSEGAENLDPKTCAPKARQ